MSKNINQRILVTGGAGFLGNHVVDELKKRGYRYIRIPRSKEFDLRKKNACTSLTKNIDTVVHLAARVGGIGYNQKFPADIFFDNTIMALNMLYASHKSKVKKFIGIGTVCAYPKYTPIPFREEDIWNGYPEETNAPYGLAKKMLLVGSHAYRKQHALNAIHLIPVNLFGPGDNFSPDSSHVIPALIQKMYQAKLNHQPSVTVWGSGNATREFLYVTDAAKAIRLAMERYDEPAPVNLGSGVDISIRKLVVLIAKKIKYHGKIIWDKTKPDGQPRRLLNTEKAFKNFGFRALVPFSLGLHRTINWYIKNYEKTT